MAPTATSLHDLPQLLDTSEVAAALRKDLYTVQRNLREGLIPGIKLPGGRWRVRRDVIEAILAGQSGQPTPAQQRAERLGDDTITFLRELAEAAPPLSDAQKDAIRAAFRACRRTGRTPRAAPGSGRPRCARAHWRGVCRSGSAPR
jgi:hypothetical protein